ASLHSPAPPALHPRSLPDALPISVATRLETGERTVFVRGNTGQAVRASSSVPGVFEPVTIGGYQYVDGGVVSPVPVDAARQLGADRKSTRLNSSHVKISYAVFCLK